MNDPRGSLPAFGTARTEQDQSTQSYSGFVELRVETPTPDRHHLHEPPHLHGTPSSTSFPPTQEGSPVRRGSSAGPDKAPLRPQDETHVSSQHEIISSSGLGQGGSENTVTKLSNLGALAQENQAKPAPFPTPSTSRQLPTSPFSSPDGHGVSNLEVDPLPLALSPAEIRRNAPLPPLPWASSPGMPPSLNYPWINPVHNRRVSNIGGGTRPSNFDRNSGMAGVTSHNNVIPGSPPLSPRIPTAALASGHGFEKSGHGMEDLPGPGPVPNQGYPTVSRSRTLRSRDWLVDTEEKERSVGKRLDPTLETARFERNKYAIKARVTAYALNIAIGLQVLIGALTTGLSAASPGKQTSIATAILGGIATLIASYLARARGSQEPELSTAKVKDLEQFIRDCETFQLDYGHSIGSTKPEQETRLQELRERFENLLGHGKGERCPAQPLGP